MAISNVSPSISSVSPPVSDSAISALVQNARKSQDQQLSAIVTLSTQGQQLSRAAPAQAAPVQPTAPTQTAPAPATPTQNTATETSPSQQSNTVGTPSSENVETKSKEASESPGIQLLEGESKGGRISTYA